MLRQLLKFKIANFSTQQDLLSKLVTKIPKEVEIDVSPGFLSIVFEHTKKSPTYILLKQLFAYLKLSPILQHEFPLIKSQQKFQENWMALHLQMLKSRIVEQKTRTQSINQLELQKFDYNAQTYFFNQHANQIHPHMPMFSFGSHFAQSYLKKFKVFQSHFDTGYEARPTQEALNGLLRKLVFENRVGFKDPELAKLSKYYIAHRRYLSMLGWQDMLHHKIKWGFEQDRSLLDHLSSPQPKKTNL